MICQQRKQQLGNVCRGSWVGFHPNDSEMFRQRQDHPITKMTVKRDERSFLLHSPLQESAHRQPVRGQFPRTRERHHALRRAKASQFDPKHLIEVKAHGGLRDIEGGDFRVQNGMPGVLQGSLNIIPRQFRVAAQQ
jgi:hypothetical protein